MVWIKVCEKMQIFGKWVTVKEAFCRMKRRRIEKIGIADNLK